MDASIDLLDSGSRATGRPRSQDCRKKTLRAAETLLLRDGFARMSVEAIAQLAGVSKATIYRWWPNKASVVMEALLQSTEAELFVPASPFPEEELITRIRRTVSLFRSPKGRIIASLIAEAQSDPEIGQAYRTLLLEPRRLALSAAIQRGIAAGIFSRGIDMTLAIDILYGPLYQRLLLGHAPLDAAFERDYPPIAVAALRGCAPAAERR
jgi:AcrR family transcriptional regulator